MTRLSLAVALTVLWALPLSAQTDPGNPTAKMLADVSAKYTGAMAALRYKIYDEANKRDNVAIGQAVCIKNDAGKGLFLTTAINPASRVQDLKDFELIVPGVGGKVIPAEFKGVDAATGIGFVQATAVHEWNVVQFWSESVLTPGQPVASLGLLVGQPAHPPYLGVAYVSTVLRVPGRLAYVTGGKLTNAGSPVFAADGKAVGLVGAQLFLGYQTAVRGSGVPLPLRGEEETSFFTPVEEFVHVLTNIPSKGEVVRPSWIGVGRFEAVKEKAEAILALGKPGIMIHQVIPGQPAAKAGLQNLDIIVGVNGKALENLDNPNLIVQNFFTQISRMKADQTIKLTVIRREETKDYDVATAPTPTLPGEAERHLDPSVGVLVREKTMLDRHDGSETAAVEGVIVVGVVQGTAAADLPEAQRPKEKDVVTKVNDKLVTNLAEFRAAMQEALSKAAPVKLIFQRGNQPDSVTITPRAPQSN